MTARTTAGGDMDGIGRVVVLGGGVAGLTAADELSRRGVAVELYDAGNRLGGRAACVDVPAIAPWHRNLINTLDGIPCGGGSVADRLEIERELTVWATGAPAGERRVLRWSDLTPTRIGQLDRIVDVLLNGGAAGTAKPFGALDVGYLAHLLGVVALADRAKLLELEHHGFVEYACGVFPQRSVLQPSARLRSWLDRNGLRPLGIARAREVSARTGLVGLLRLLNPVELHTVRGDRTVAGAREWLDPWVADLTARSAHRPHPVRVHREAVRRLELDGDRVIGIETASGAVDRDVDRVVCALPPSALPRVLAPLPDRVAGVEQLRESWMGAASYRLTEDAPVLHGRAIHLDTPWSLTSAMRRPCELTVTITDGDEPSPVLGRPARDCSDAEVLAEVWRQLRTALGRHAGALAADRRDVVAGERLDAATSFINTVGSWVHRPESDAGFENLYLAGDYVRTNADAATFESANESGRRAARALLDAAGHDGPAVKITAADHLGLVDD